MFEKYYIHYWNLKEGTSPDTLASNIRWIISEYKLNHSEIVLLAESIKLLRDIETAYVYSTNLGTMINFETAAQYKDVINLKQPKEVDNIGDLVPPVAVFWYRRFTLSDFS